MQFNIHSFNLNDAESWLIMLIYAVFWGYSYYSLIVLLLYLNKQKKLTESDKKSLEITN